MSVQSCGNCGNESPYHKHGWIESGEYRELCNVCGAPPPPGVPDVFLPRCGMTFQNLTDDMGKPIPIMSKRHKQEVMDAKGVRECPERLTPTTWIDGTRAYRNKQFDQVDRPMIRETLRRYKERARAK